MVMIHPISQSIEVLGVNIWWLLSDWPNLPPTLPQISYIWFVVWLYRLTGCLDLCGHLLLQECVLLCSLFWKVVSKVFAKRRQAQTVACATSLRIIVCGVYSCGVWMSYKAKKLCGKNEYHTNSKRGWIDSSYEHKGWALVLLSIRTLLKMGRYYSTTMCHYWDMSVK